MDKRCYNTAEAMAYLGIKRRSFETRILPYLEGKGIRIGTAVVFERVDLDAAWEKYKIAAGSKRDGNQTEASCVAQKRPASIARETLTKSTKYTKESGFANAASKILKMRRTGSLTR